MSTTYVPASTPRPHGDTTAQFGSIVRRIRNHFRDILDRRASIAELEALDDRILKDIGITRTEIAAVVDQNILDRRQAEGVL